jgi:L,D-transpeptidase catalytic domain
VRRLECWIALAAVGVTGCARGKHKQNPPAPPASHAVAAKLSATAALPPASADPPPDAGAAPPADDGAPRVYALTRFVWIEPTPAYTEWMGYMWFGGSVKLKSTKPHYGPGCSHAWYAIEPHGYVCVDGERATLDKNDPTYRAILPYAPDLNSPWPHHYGESRGAERYRAIPTLPEEHAREWDFDAHMKAIAAALAGAKRGPSLLGVDLTPAPEASIALPKVLPPAIYENRMRLRLLSTVAWSREEEKNGRSWLLSDDLMWVPKDRVAPYPKVTFHGVRLGADAKLPLAFFRRRDQPKYRRAPDGSFSETGDKWARLDWVELTGQSVDSDGKTYLETRDHGLYVEKQDAVAPVLAKQTPWGAPLGERDTNAHAPRGRRTWIEVSVYGGWLVAYRDVTPVYATMISPGRGGVPVPGKTALETASTPTGTFYITGKFATATMVAPHEFIHSSVPWTQNFHGPQALHGAYWHNRWGELESGGCINASPIDGKWLFDFTEPALPPGWHGVRWEPHLEPATLMVVHR